MGTRFHHPKETKWKAIDMKQARYTNREVMETLGIKNITTILMIIIK